MQNNYASKFKKGTNEVIVSKFRAPTYGLSIWVVVCRSFKKSSDFIEEHFDEKCMDKEDMASTRAFAFCPYDENGVPHVVLLFKPHATINEICHECNHAKNLIFQYHGVKLSLSNDESESYFLGWMAGACDRAIKKYKKIHK